MASLLELRRKAESLGIQDYGKYSKQELAEMIDKIHYKPEIIQEVIGDRKGYPRKPDPTTVLEIAEKLGTKPEETAYLGDSSVDMQTAVNAGFLPVGVLWGFRGRDELIEHGAKVLLAHPAELLEKVTFTN